jgi:hypothetical protein
MSPLLNQEGEKRQTANKNVEKQAVRLLHYQRRRRKQESPDEPLSVFNLAVISPLTGR